METEMKKLGRYPGKIMLPAAATVTVAIAAANPGAFCYTSLRDVIPSSPRSDHAIAGKIAAVSWSSSRHAHRYHLVDASSIPIRNQLVKHAASAYVQSAVLLYRRNESCLSRMWARLAEGTAWACHARELLSSYTELVLRSVRRVLACVVDHVGGAAVVGGGRPVM